VRGMCIGGVVSTRRGEVSGAKRASAILLMSNNRSILLPPVKVSVEARRPLFAAPHQLFAGLASTVGRCHVTRFAQERRLFTSGARRRA